MSFLILLGVAWFLLPIVTQIITTITARPLIQISQNIEGFWDTVASGKAPSFDQTEGSHARFWDGKNFVDTWSENWGNRSQTEPPKGNWR